MDAILQFVLTIVLTIFGAMIVRAALVGGDSLPGMPRLKSCPRCGLAAEATSFANDGILKRRQVLPLILFFTLFMIGMGLMLGGLLFALRSPDAPHLAGRLMVLGGGGLAFLLGLYLGAWSIKYMHRRPIVECFKCGWKKGMRA